jgi:adenylate cyclase
MYHERRFPKLGGDEAVLTAFFTDIQSFSTFSEKLGSPTRLVELLNEYLTAMTDILFAHGGTLDKYEGDAILAFFGAPVPMADHAAKACATALAMQRRLDELRRKWQSEGERWPSLVHGMRMRIGINTGPIVYGNMGSTVRKNFTMMGDAVNLAARLEGAAKQYGVYTMVSDATYVAADKAFEVRQLDRIQVVGKSEPVVVYELLAEKGALPADLKALVEKYNEGLALYYARQWAQAETVLTEAEALEPMRAAAPGGMSPSRRIIDVCRANRANPPGPEWDGVTRLTMKE